jgi:long-chain fatty acid transport protein
MGFSLGYGETGHVVSGVGAINHSMAGAAAAMPLDASGALFWNPASITDLERSEVDVNVEPVLLDIHLQSSLGADSIAPGIPAAPLSGDTRSDLKVVVLPSVAWVHRPPGKRWATGLGVFGIGGFGVEYQDDSNPILTPQPPNGFGFGSLRTRSQFIQFAPTLAYRLNEHLSVGVSPNIDVSALESKPFPGASPDDANGDGFATYPDAKLTWAVGGGVQGGLYFKRKGVHLGAAIKSPQWFEPYHYKSQDEAGRPRAFKFRLDFPMIVTAGVGYSGLKRLKWAADVKYIDYRNTQGFNQSGIDPETQAVRGFGWKSIWAFATGLQYQVTERLSVRTGYGYSQNPVRNQEAAFSVGAPGIIKHHVNAGLTYQIKENFLLALAYHHGFANSVQGPFQTPLGLLPGTSVRTRTSSTNLVLSLIFKY